MKLPRRKTGIPRRAQKRPTRKGKEALTIIPRSAAQGREHGSHEIAPAYLHSILVSSHRHL